MLDNLKAPFELDWKEAATDKIVRQNLSFMLGVGSVGSDRDSSPLYISPILSSFYESCLTTFVTRHSPGFPDFRYTVQ